MEVLILAILSIATYVYLIPILDRLNEYIQAIILTKKMKVNVEYAQYEKMVSEVNEEQKSSTGNAIGFKIEEAKGEEDEK